MTRRDRLFQSATAAVVLLHAAAFLFFPAQLWGVSHLAVWPKLVGLGWTALALVGLYVPFGASTRWTFAFPGPGKSALAALIWALPFWILRERIHLFGDGALLIRDGGFSESFARAPLLVHAATAAVHVGNSLGVPVASSLAAVSIAAGSLSIFAVFRLAAALTPDRGGRYLVLVLLVLCGSRQLFLGHVEYYGMLAAAVLVYLWLACRALQPGASQWPAWLAFAVLPVLHFGTLALLPAQLYFASVEWRASSLRRRIVLRNAALALLVTVVLAAVAGSGPAAAVSTALGGARRYLEPYFATASAKHAFGLFSPAHLLAFLNDLLLIGSMAVAAIPALWSIRRTPYDPVHRFLALAAVGGLTLSFFFHRELGPYRDWDLLAWNGFVLLAFVAARFVRPHPGSQRVALRIAFVGGFAHLSPWIMMQVFPRATIRHAEIVMRSPTQHSPHARGYMYEEIAIWHRQKGDAEASLRAYQAAVTANPADARYHVGLGTLYVQRGAFEPAIAEFEAALRVRPDFPPAHNNLAYALWRAGRDLENARTHVERALAADPENADYRMTQARILLALGDRDAALRAVDAALQARPGMTEAQTLRNEIAAQPAP